MAGSFTRESPQVYYQFTSINLSVGRFELARLKGNWLAKAGSVVCLATNQSASPLTSESI